MDNVSIPCVLLLLILVTEGTSMLENKKGAVTKCPLPDSIDNGYFEIHREETTVTKLTAEDDNNIDNTFHFYRALYHCHDGYSLVDTTELLCQNGGGWRGTLPSCKAIECPPLAPPSDPRLRMTCSDGGRYGSECVFECTIGYQLDGPPMIACEGGATTEGVWSGPLPLCKLTDQPITSLLTCTVLTLPDNAETLTCTDGNNWGSECDFRCQPGYAVVGKQPLRCDSNGRDVSSDGRWDHDTPRCQAITCDELPLPGNAERIQCTDGTNFGSTCAVECRVGYKLVGDLLLTCIDMQDGSTTTRGMWDGTVPRCRAPVTSIFAQSEGGDNGGMAGIEINGINYSRSNEGFNVAVIRSGTDDVITTRDYDVAGNATQKSEMLQFLSEQVEDGDVIIMAVSGNAAVSFVEDGGSEVMKGLGVGSHERCPLNIGFRESWCLITQKSADGETLPDWFNCNWESRDNGRVVATAEIPLVY